MFFLFLLFSFFLIGKIFYLQNLEVDENTRSTIEAVKNIEVEPSRGNIYSDNGDLIVSTVIKYELRWDSKTPSLKVFDDYILDLSRELSLYFDKTQEYFFNYLNNARDNNNRYLLIGKNLSYKTLLNIINNNLKYFNNNDTNKLELEIEQLKLMLEMKTTNNDNLLIKELVQSVKQLSCQINNLEKTNQEMMEKLNSIQTKTVTGFNEPLVTLGPRLQKINPETMTIIKVYESVAECLNEYNFKVKRPSIDKAVKENTIYMEYRWAFVDRSLDPNIIHNILPTKQTKIQNLGYIAKLNTEKTQILNVYLDRKTAASHNGYASSSALDTPVKNASLTNGHYYHAN